MTEEDEQEFMDFVMSTGDVEILPFHMTSETESLRVLPAPDSRNHWRKVYLRNTEIGGRINIRFYENLNVYIAEESDACVIHFTRSLPWKGGLYIGRIWAEFDMLDYEIYELVPKDPAFVKWYEKIARWLKRRYKRVDVMTYAGPGALKFREEHGEW